MSCSPVIKANIQATVGGIHRMSLVRYLERRGIHTENTSLTRKIKGFETFVQILYHLNVKYALSYSLTRLI